MHHKNLSLKPSGFEEVDWTRSWTQGTSSVQTPLCIHGALTTNTINISELARTKQSNKQLHLLIVSPGQKVISYSKTLQESVSNMVAIASVLTRRQMFLPTSRFTLALLSWFLFLFFYFFWSIRNKENMEREKNICSEFSYVLSKSAKNITICSNTFTLHANFILDFLHLNTRSFALL